ncbi:hypothetical protein HMPREF9466_01653 [Fusobacterium necrophorum subsp. funduliforme 1_1_36S]|nr:hypothetical protein HMPREF9466_01653 [Fusobacterium necrophorum subsp. funduliforme 1_1_36S]
MFYKYPHIGQFRDVVDYINHNYEEKPIIVFKGTTKLHGTNGAIVYTLNDKYLVQSRNRTLCLEHDNQGFFQFMNQAERKNFLTSVLKEKLLEANIKNRKSKELFCLVSSLEKTSKRELLSPI